MFILCPRRRRSQPSPPRPVSGAGRTTESENRPKPGKHSRKRKNNRSKGQRQILETFRLPGHGKIFCPPKTRLRLTKASRKSLGEQMMRLAKIIHELKKPWTVK